MRQRAISWSTALHELRAERLNRPSCERPPISGLLPPPLIDAEGAFNRAGIMRRAHATARRHQISQPNRPWKELMAEALRLAWFEARTAKKAGAARLAA